jgi:hypothetical protein
MLQREPLLREIDVVDDEERPEELRRDASQPEEVFLRIREEEEEVVNQEERVLEERGPEELPPEAREEVPLQEAAEEAAEEGLSGVYLRQEPAMHPQAQRQHDTEEPGQRRETGSMVEYPVRHTREEPAIFPHLQRKHDPEDRPEEPVQRRETGSTIEYPSRDNSQLQEDASIEEDPSSLCDASQEAYDEESARNSSSRELTFEEEPDEELGELQLYRVGHYHDDQTGMTLEHLCL